MFLFRISDSVLSDIPMAPMDLSTASGYPPGTVAGGKGVAGGDAVAGGHDTGHVSPVTISCHYIVIKKRTFRSCHVSTWIVPELGWGGFFLVEQC